MAESRADWAIIFDVDGVLLELTRDEEELFFEPFRSRCDVTKLSRDWNSYQIRNDEDIIKELVGRHQLHPSETKTITAEYLMLLEDRLHTGQLQSQVISGASGMLNKFKSRARLGIATANFRRAAELRLKQTGLWDHVSGLAHGADGGGHKSAILARAIKSSGLSPQRIIFIGDNVNDVVAGLENGVHFIGFSESAERREKLAAHGARNLSGSHAQTETLLEQLLNP
jgi:phosphoglycolate phosphatase-like HAD superfamily hydrolase